MSMYRLLIPCLLIALHLGCGEESSAEKEMPLERTTNVSTFVIKPDSLVQYSRLSATVNAWRDVTISALESGEVINTYKDVGDYVNRGEDLAQLNMELLQAALIEAEANLKFQAYNYERSKQLFAEGSISEQAHFATEYDFQKAKSTAQTLKHRLSYGRIQAPFSGTIAKRHLSQGQHIVREVRQHIASFKPIACALRHGSPRAKSLTLPKAVSSASSSMLCRTRLMRAQSPMSARQQIRTRGFFPLKFTCPTQQGISAPA